MYTLSGSSRSSQSCPAEIQDEVCLHIYLVFLFRGSGSGARYYMLFSILFLSLMKVSSFASPLGCVFDLTPSFVAPPTSNSFIIFPAPSTKWASTQIKPENVIPSTNAISINYVAQVTNLRHSSGIFLCDASFRMHRRVVLNLCGTRGPLMYLLPTVG